MISMSIATMQDAAEMAPRMRAADALEVLSAGGYSPLGALEDSILMSSGSAWTVRHEGEIIGIWGVVDSSALTGHGVPWLLTTALIETCQKDFYKGSLAVVAILRRRYALLSNYVDARHVQALRWARRIGFQVAERPVPFGVAQVPFHRIDLIGGSHV